MGTFTDLLPQHQHSELLASHNVALNPHDQAEKQDMEVCRVESRLVALESEQKKIDAFKRELPLCMQLLHKAIEASKEQLAFHRFSSCKQLKRPVSCSLDNRTSDVESDTIGSERLAKGKPPNSDYANSNEGEHLGKRHCTRTIGNDIFQWMNPRAELNGGYGAGYQFCGTFEERAQWYMNEQAFSSSASPVSGSKQKLGGAFAPFSRNSRLVQPTPRPGAINPADLSLKCPESGITGPPNSFEIVEQKVESSAGLESSISTKCGNSLQLVKETFSKEKQAQSDGIQLSRKTRRSWSPELHQLFVDALQKLGGTQATPKQIRELMKVDGLTNDEVKSHLQKYRLHTKRLSFSPPSLSQASCVIPIGRAWAPSAYASHFYNTTSRQSESCETSSTQENATELDCSGQLHSQVSRCSVKDLLHRRRVRQQQPVQHINHPSAGRFRLSDVGGEESVGEVVKLENLGSKGHHQPRLQLHEPDEIEYHSSNSNQTYSFGEDDKDYEDSPNGL